MGIKFEYFGGDVEAFQVVGEEHPAVVSHHLFRTPFPHSQLSYHP